ncbi:sugar phosphate isomerase/epimerase family protein [Caldicellulosiruptoraceae bacterium PP1]
MKFGVCISNFENAVFLSQLGYSYIELGLQEIADLSDDEFLNLYKACQRNPIKAEVFNSCIRRYNIVGPNVDWDNIKIYIAKAIPRAYLLGAQIIVFGSGGARRVPDRFSREIAKQQIIDFLKFIGDFSAKFNIKIAIENLNNNECNILNTVEEELEYVEKCNLANVGVLADFYHMRVENEDFNVLKKVSNKLFHVHIANSNGRFYPKNIDEDNYKDFFAVLNEIGYDKRISIEARLVAETDYENAFNVLNIFL